LKRIRLFNSGHKWPSASVA